MSKHTFTMWLREEVVAARCALLTLYEQRDKLRYIEKPRLEKEYMDKVGTYEETVIQEEIECELLQKKQQKIQVAVNRREPIDEIKIDEELEDERQEMLKEAAGPEELDEYEELTVEESDKLQDLYSDIVQNFHPQIHPDLTEAHRQLFQKAQESYRSRDVQAMNLVHDMLHSTQEEEADLEMLLEFLTDNEDDEELVEASPQIEFATDYSLAAMIYCGFKPTNEEAAMQEELARCRQMTDEIMQQMDDMKCQFPFNASDMLSDDGQMASYKEELEHRLRTATVERERRTKEISAIIESVNSHE